MPDSTAAVAEQPTQQQQTAAPEQPAPSTAPESGARDGSIASLPDLTSFFRDNPTTESPKADDPEQPKEAAPANPDAELKKQARDAALKALRDVDDETRRQLLEDEVLKPHVEQVAQAKAQQQASRNIQKSRDDAARQAAIQAHVQAEREMNDLVAKANAGDWDAKEQLGNHAAAQWATAQAQHQFLQTVAPQIQAQAIEQAKSDVAMAAVEQAKGHGEWPKAAPEAWAEAEKAETLADYFWPLHQDLLKQAQAEWQAGEDKRTQAAIKAALDQGRNGSLGPDIRRPDGVGRNVGAANNPYRSAEQDLVDVFTRQAARSS